MWLLDEKEIEKAKEKEFRLREIILSVKDYVNRNNYLYNPPLFIVDETVKDIWQLSVYLLDKFDRIETENLPEEVNFYLKRAMSRVNGQSIYIQSAIRTIFTSVKVNFLESVEEDSFLDLVKGWKIFKENEEGERVEVGKFDLIKKLNDVGYFIEREHKKEEDLINISKVIDKYFDTTSGLLSSFKLRKKDVFLYNNDVMVYRKDKVIVLLNNSENHLVDKE